MLKSAPFLCLSIAAFPAVVFAQRSAPLPPQPPLSAQNPLAKPKGPPQEKSARPRRGSMGVGGLIDYMDRDMAEAPGDIDAPVTGYGNEALWELAKTSRPVAQNDDGPVTRSPPPAGSTVPPSTR